MLDQMMQTPWIVIAGMALVTAATRYAGYAVIGRLGLSARMRDALQAVPASVLTAIIAPTVLATGPAETVAAAATLLIVWRFPALAAIVGGVVAVIVMRQIF